MMKKETRNYSVKRTASVQKAVALLVPSPVSKMIGVFFMGLDKPVGPTQIFTNTQPAIKWMHSFRNA